MPDDGARSATAARASRSLAAARIATMVRRYVYLLQGSWPRTLELIYWPTIQMILWGFTSKFLMTNSAYVARASGVLLGAVLLWDVMFRGQLGVSVSFLEELWSRNLAQLFISPLRPWEWALSLLAMSLVRVGIGVVPAALLAIPLYHYSIFTLGLPLVAFFVLLIVMGWAIGLLIGALLLRHGLGAESLAWLAVFVLAPASAVYYPVSVLPHWLQLVAWTLPSAHVFEGMRTVILEHRFALGHFAAAAGLDLVYLGLGTAVFPAQLRACPPHRRAGPAGGMKRGPGRIMRQETLSPRQRTLTPESIVARVERLPVSPWHVRMRIIVGSATFFDAFDALAIAFVAPALAALWHLSPQAIGILVSGGFIGQVIGGCLFGWLAERYGRLRALTWAIGVLSVFSLACAFASSFGSLYALRFIQGLGLGGELPVAITYINEFAKAERRGFFVLIYQSIFPVGIIAVSLSAVWIVPHLGWQWMFIIGALPGIIAVMLLRVLPESPRWLVSRGRLAEADRVLAGIEAAVSDGGRRVLPAPRTDVPPVAAVRASWRDLFAGIYLRRTVTVLIMGFISSFVGFGITIWLPTIYRTVFKLPVAQSLMLSVWSNVALLLGVLTCTFVIDRIGRRVAFTAGFFFSALPLLAVWAMGSGITVTALVVLATIASYFAAQLQLGMSLYPTEIYPTRIRALGAGITGSSTRAGSIVGPPLVGYVLQTASLGADFLMLAAAALIGAATMLVSVETRGRLLEELSP